MIRLGPCWVGTLVLMLALLACHRGSGSDIGPDLRPLPAGDYRVLVRNDQGEAVVEAVVSIAGVSRTGTTGQTGRAVINAVFSGIRVITVDGTNASATDTDELGTIAINAQTPDGNELPFTVFLPDVSGSTDLTLTTGLQGSLSTLDDSSTSSGAVLTVSAGDTVTFGQASSVTLKTGPLADVHLPGTIPGFLPGQAFTGRGVFLSPAGVQFSFGAALSLPNDLNLATNAIADLYHQDPTTGTWFRVGSGTETSGRIVAAAGSVQFGGLYCFVASSSSTTAVSGRVLDKLQDPVPGVLVRGPQAVTRTNSAGNYALPAMTRKDGSNLDRTVTVEFDGGRDFLPVRTTTSVSLDAATKVLSDTELDTVRVRDVRVLMINRGLRDPLRRINMSGESGLQNGIGVGNEVGETQHDALPVGFVGYQTTKPISANHIARTLGVFEMKSETFVHDLRVFGDERGWVTKRDGSTLTRVVDKRGTGPIESAWVVVGDQPNAGLEDRTTEFGITGADIGRRGQVTAVFSSESDGRRVISAITMVKVNTGDLSLPVARANRTSLGAFERHGLFSGSITSSAGSNTRRVRASGTMTLQGFYNESFLGQPATFQIPKKVDPAVTSGTTYTFGVPAGLGYLAATEGTTTTGVFTLERMGLALNLKAVEGTRTTQNLDLSLVANTPFTVTNALVNKDSTIPDSALRFDLAAELIKNALVDIDRDIGGNHTVSGSDLIFSLPAVSALPAALRGYVLGLHGSATTSGRTITQQTFIRVDGVNAPTVPMHPAPTVTSPTPGGTISASGFTVQLASPTNTLYTVLELCSETVISASLTEVREWTVILPRETTSFSFVQLPSGVPTPLIAGLTWTFTATSLRIDGGLLIAGAVFEEDAYVRVLANWVGLEEAGQEVAAFASNAFTVTSN